MVKFRTHQAFHWKDHSQTERETKQLPADFPALAIFDCFSGQTTEEIKDLLESNHIFCVFVPAQCTDRLQPLDISVNKAAKDHLREQFWAWYADQDRRQLEDGTEPENVKVDTKLSVIKTPSAKWLVSMYDYLRSKPEITIHGFKKAGITQAIEEGPDKVVSLEPESDDDPFADLSD